MPFANLLLSQEESELLGNRDVILTKNAVQSSLYDWMGQLGQRYQLLTDGWHNVHPTAFSISPKVSRGENYKGFPWLMLDYPRLFSHTDVCAIRSFCWWGHYCSITLHLAGESLYQFRENIKCGIADIHIEELENWYLSTGEDPWVHELDGGAYLPLDKVGEGYWEKETDFLKLAKKIPLEQWDRWEYHFEKTFIQLNGLLGTSGT